MIFKKHNAEIKRLKQHIRTQDVELQYLRSVSHLNSTWKSACDQKDEIIEHQQQELERLRSTVDATKQLQLENKKLHQDLYMQELEIKKLLVADASDFGWKVVADERGEVIKDQKKDIEAMKSRNDAAKELQADHQKLQGDYTHLQQTYNKLREEKTKSDERISDLEVRLNARTFAPPRPIRPLPYRPFQAKLPSSRGYFGHGGAQGARGAAPQGQRTVDDVLIHVSNGGDLPPMAIRHLQNQLFLWAASLCRLDEVRFNELVTDRVSGIICIQQKAFDVPATVPENRNGACHICVMLGRIGLQKESSQSVVVVPLPESLRPGKRVDELGYWIRGR